MFLGASLFNIVSGMPFLPLQTLYINFTVDLFLAIGIGLGAASPGLMQRPPRGADAQILPRSHCWWPGLVGLVMAASSLLACNAAEGSQGETVARSHGAGHIRARRDLPGAGEQRRSGRSSARRRLTIGKLMQMSLYSLVATIAVTEIGLFQRIFDTESLSVNQWLVSAAVGSAILWVMEIYKFSIVAGHGGERCPPHRSRRQARAHKATRLAMSTVAPPPRRGNAYNLFILVIRRQVSDHASRPHRGGVRHGDGYRHHRLTGEHHGQLPGLPTSMPPRPPVASQQWARNSQSSRRHLRVYLSCERLQLTVQFICRADHQRAAGDAPVAPV